MIPSATPPYMALIGNLGPWEILIILSILLLLFGGRKLPELARGLGRSIKELKKAASEAQEDIHVAINGEPPTEKTKAAPTIPLEKPKKAFPAKDAS